VLGSNTKNPPKKPPMNLKHFTVSEVRVGKESGSMIMFGSYNDTAVVGKLWAGDKPNLQMERQVYTRLRDKWDTPHVPIYVGAFDGTVGDVRKMLPSNKRTNEEVQW
jgi:hypothetical protein